MFGPHSALFLPKIFICSKLPDSARKWDKLVTTLCPALRAILCSIAMGRFWLFWQFLVTMRGMPLTICDILVPFMFLYLKLSGRRWQTNRQMYRQSTSRQSTTVTQIAIIYISVRFANTWTWYISYLSIDCIWCTNLFLEALRI